MEMTQTAIMKNKPAVWHRTSNKDDVSDINCTCAPMRQDFTV